MQAAATIGSADVKCAEPVWRLAFNLAQWFARRGTAALDQQRATQNRIKVFWSTQLETGARAGASTRCSERTIPTIGGTADPDERGVESAKGVSRPRFSPPLLNALSSFTVEPTPKRRTETESSVNCVGPETGLADDATTGGCNEPVVVAARKDQQPSTAARSASTATMADADCRRDHRESSETPKLTVSLTLPAAIPHLPRATPVSPNKPSVRRRRRQNADSSTEAAWEHR